MDERIEAAVSRIRGADTAMLEKAAAYQDTLAKPPHSLGKLEDISVRIAGITGRIHSEIKKKRIIVLCADNGITEEGISSAPVSVTAAQAVNMTRSCTGMSSMAAYFGDEMQIVDVGIAEPYSCEEVVKAVIRRGTANFMNEDAMSREEAVSAVLLGIRLAAQAGKDGIDAVGVGEMGIGNTSTSSAVLSVLTGLDIEEITGRGGGLTDKAFQHKKDVLKEAVRRRNPDPRDVISVLSCVGGLDIAAMCGVFLGCAIERIPAVIDGFISAVAALCAARICPEAADFMFPSHASYEPGYMKTVSELGLDPYLNLDMRLGEGSGCVLAFEIMAAACAMTNGMARFNEDSGINDGYLEEIRAGDSFSV